MIAEITEVPGPGEVPHYVHPGWAEQFPWLIQGTTARGNERTPFDLALFGRVDPGAALDRMLVLSAELGCNRAVLGKQIHGGSVASHKSSALGLKILPATDGHMTDTEGIFMAVTVADCVPVFLVEPKSRVVGLLHAGWRGAAADILETGLAKLTQEYEVKPNELWVHFGPAADGTRYEVGAEVFEALGLAAPSEPTPIDLRAELARRAGEAGVPLSQVSISTHSTMAPDSPFFSHRRGDLGRQVAFLAIRPGDAASSLKSRR